MLRIEVMGIAHWRDRFKGHLAGKPGLVGCPIKFPSPFSPRLCILPRQTKSFHILLDTIPSSLPRTSHWFSSFHFRRCATFNPAIHTFHVSKPSQSTFLPSSIRSTCPNHLNLPFYSHPYVPTTTTTNLFPVDKYNQ